MVWHARVNAPNAKDKWNFNLSDAVIGVTKATGNRFKKMKNFSDKYKTIYNGVTYSGSELFYRILTSNTNGAYVMINPFNYNLNLQTLIAVWLMCG